MKTADFEYELPPELIAQTPVTPRHASRLMVVERATGRIAHRRFYEIVEYLRPGDLLVANDSRVIPARMYGHKVPTGGKVEVLLLAKRGERLWEALTRGKHLVPGTAIALDALEGMPALTCRVVEVTEAGSRLLEFDVPVEPWLEKIGVIPLPPYIHVPLADRERYQTVYARVNGSVAAPTAGLHFTPELMEQVRALGAEFVFVTLHIGLDTFRPVQEEEVEQHRIHTEWCTLPAETAERINAARREGRRIIAVGTTSVRVLETGGKLAAERGNKEVVVPFTGRTDLFIYPGFTFRAVDAMITNFHLPRSTLLMLVSAFAGRELILQAYQEAVRQRYRFYSFGDAMFIL